MNWVVETPTPGNSNIDVPACSRKFHVYCPASGQRLHSSSRIWLSNLKLLSYLHIQFVEKWILRVEYAWLQQQNHIFADDKCLFIARLRVEDHWPFGLGQFAAGNVKQEWDNEAAVVSSPQQFADSVERQRQNTTNQTASPALHTHDTT